MKTKSFLLGGSILAACLAGGCGFQSDGPQHVFQIQSAPPLLTEELAVAKAREAFAQEVSHPDDWQRAPIFTRRGPNDAEVRFIQKIGSRDRTYEVRLETNRVICYYHHGI